MLVTVLVMAVAVSLEPFRVGMTMLMLKRPRPLLQLLAFLSGGVAMGMTVGLAVLFVFRRILVGSTYFTLPRVQMVIGLLALLAAAVLAVRVATGRSSSLRLPARTHLLLHGRSLWVAGVAGLGIALPSVDYLAALAVILASGATATTQVGALLMFNAVAFAFVEIPLLACLLAPRATRAATAALHGWIRARRRLEVAALLAVVGSVLLLAGLTGH
ncbi:GAP family protein [Mycobacterium sp. THU-M104]|uniref:GAP family protein n=1 Tax=Mycobacterium sp. THU-M104 TaxID=3410515 RepID=UPI003B990178